jgi:DNA-binding HxlR family transcriptional regulator
MVRKKGYGQFCPVAKASEIIAERWTPLVLRELLCGSQRFNDIRRGVPLMSPSLLSQRLKELEWAGIIERRAAPEDRGWEYCLTEAGESLRPIVEQLGFWGDRFARSQMKGDDLDPGLLMWDVRRGVKADHLPDGRVVIFFELSGAPKNKKYWWLVKDRDGVDLCMKDPGFDVDLTLSADLRTMTRVWMGDFEIREALGSGKLKLEGSAALKKSFRRWIGLSFFAQASSPI